MSFLVTGGTGLIGSQVVEKLVQEQKKVIVYDFLPNMDNIKDIADRVVLVRGDILDTTELLSTMKKNNVQYVIHLAAYLQLEAMDNPTMATIVCCVGTNNIFDVARTMNVRRVVYASSLAVYGSAHLYEKLVVDEDDLPRPSEPYALCKFFNEGMGLYYYERFGLDTVGLRPCMIYGTGRYTGTTGLFNNVVRQVALEKRATFPALLARNSKFNLLYTKDLANCFILACLAKDPGYRIFNTSGEKPCTMGEIANILKELIPDASIEFESENSPAQLATLTTPVVDGARIRKQLGFRQSFTLKQGLRDVINFHRKEKSMSLI